MGSSEDLSGGDSYPIEHQCDGRHPAWTAETGVANWRLVTNGKSQEYDCGMDEYVYLYEVERSTRGCLQIDEFESLSPGCLEQVPQTCTVFGSWTAAAAGEEKLEVT